MIQEKQALLSFVETTLRSLIDPKLIEDSITSKGMTQKSELITIDLVETVFSLAKEEGKILNFVKASSQLPYDFRYSLPSETLGLVSECALKSAHKLEFIPSNLGLFEVKKTETGKLMLNDTLPDPSSHYLVFNLKKKKRLESPPTIKLFSGESVISGLNNVLKKPGVPCPYEDIYEYQRHILNLREITGFCPRMNLSISADEIPGSPIFTILLDRK